MNVLVLGGNGFIGSYLVDILVREGCDVSVYDMAEEKFRRPNSGVKYIQGSLLDYKKISESLKGIEVVYHLISTTDPKTSMSDPSGDVSSNLLGSVNLLQECVDKKVKKIVFISSGGTVYGIPERNPINENAELNPICAYGITKLAIEKYLEMFRVNYGLEYSILRPSNAYGPRQDPSGNVGAITLFIKNAIEKKKIVVWGDGSITRDYIFASDVAEGIFKGSLIKESNIFNLGSGHGVSLNELIENIKRKLSLEFEVEYHPTRNYDVPQIYLDIARARELINWEPKVSLNDGIQLTYDFLNRIIL